MPANVLFYLEAMMRLSSFFTIPRGTAQPGAMIENAEGKVLLGLTVMSGATAAASAVSAVKSLRRRQYAPALASGATAWASAKATMQGYRKIRGR